MFDIKVENFVMAKVPYYSTDYITGNRMEREPKRRNQQAKLNLRDKVIQKMKFKDDKRINNWNNSKLLCRLPKEQNVRLNGKNIAQEEAQRKRQRDSPKMMNKVNLNKSVNPNEPKPNLLKQFLIHNDMSYSPILPNEDTQSNAQNVHQNCSTPSSTDSCELELMKQIYNADLPYKNQIDYKTICFNRINQLALNNSCLTKEWLESTIEMRQNDDYNSKEKENENEEVKENDVKAKEDEGNANHPKQICINATERPVIIAISVVGNATITFGGEIQINTHPMEDGDIDLSKIFDL